MNKLLFFFYDLFVNSVKIMLPIATLFSKKVKFYVEGQKDLKGHLQNIQKLRVENAAMKIVWFHCASLGEFEQGKPVLEVYKNNYPDHKILLTFFSSSGYNVKKYYKNADFIMYLPLDTAAKTKEFIQIVKPSLAVFVKYEFWPNIISKLAENRIPVIGISVILRADQLFFKSYGGFYREILSKFQRLFIQNTQTAHLLDSINFKDYIVTGDTRFDAVVLNSKNISTNTEIEKFIGTNKNIIVCGSVWQSDMDILIPLINQNHNYKFIIAPHDIYPEEIRKWREAIYSITALYSDGQINDDSNVVFIDSVGILKTLYKYAKVSFIGGGLGKGLTQYFRSGCF